MIRVRELRKEYKVARHHRGAWGAVRNLFEPRYDVIAAVDGIDFDIRAGEFVGFLGPLADLEHPRLVR